MHNSVYMVLPPNVKTGGPEAGFQFVRALTDLNIDAKIAFTGEGKNRNPVCSAFLHYRVSYIDFNEIEDLETNIVVFPEIFIGLSSEFKKAKKVIWWLSVDNYLNHSSPLRYIKAYRKRILSAVYRGFEGVVRGTYRKIKKAIPQVDLHLYQSEYARQFLESKGFYNCLPLSDYLTDLYLSVVPETNNRENIVLYNPRKGIEFTKKIMNRMADTRWLALENMTTEQIYDTLHKAKVYIDFGSHPGKDRLPREAAISGCCIITGRNGSAANPIDVDIPEKYKFHNRISEIGRIRDAILECMCDYESRSKDFIPYREEIRNEKRVFTDQVKQVILYFQASD